MDIFEACRVGDLDQVNNLIRVEGLDVNIVNGSPPPYDVTPLGVAAENGHLEIVRLLLESGANVNSRCPLSRAARCGDIEIVEELLKAGANVNDEYYIMSPLGSAASYGHLEIMKLLLKK